MRLALIALIVLGLVPCAALAAPMPVQVHTVWFEGADTERVEHDAFMRCLLDGSTLPYYFEGEAEFTNAGSFLVPPPPAPFAIDGADVFVEQLLINGLLPETSPDVVPVYLLIVSQPTVKIRDCGRYRDAEVLGRRIGISMIRRTPVCWAGTTVMRNITQTAMHELSELTDYLLGYAGCAADNACEGRQSCGDGCENLVGLECEGAPVDTYTGCRARVVDGWVVQKLGRTGREQSKCLSCYACEFTPRVAAPGCANAPSSMTAVIVLVIYSRRRRRC